VKSESNTLYNPANGHIKVSSEIVKPTKQLFITSTAYASSSLSSAKS